MKIVIVFFMLLCVNTLSMAQVDPIDENKVAIGGFDVTTYFDLAAPLKGNPSYSHQHKGLNYHFVSAENKAKFVASPDKFLPQYDGFCALGISYGTKISIDPATYKIVDDKLYLFYHVKEGGKKVNSLDTWNKNEGKLLKKADDLWPKVSATKYNPRKTR